jgi:hypothetical protein
MTAFEDGLWARLVDEHGADRVTLACAPKQTRKRPLVVGGSLTALAAISAAAVLAINAVTSAPPAYALTKHADGSITVTIHQLATAVRALNARFARMGIDEKVVPVKASCATPAAPPMSFVDPHLRANDTLTFTPGRKGLQPGYAGVLAAQQLPHGHIAMAMEWIKPPVPSCFSTPAYRLMKGGIKMYVPGHPALTLKGR